MSEKKKKKPQKVKARLPRGFVDRDAGDIRALDHMMDTIRGVYERYGFDPVETPLFEYTDTLGKFLPDTDRPNEGVFSVQDDDEQWMSLRYDLTAPLARYVAENYDALPKPYRSYRAGIVFRNEKPGPGRFRQFMQFDADTVGAPGVQADAEMCMMMADTMEALGIPRGQYVIRVSSRKILDGLLKQLGIEDETQKLAVLRSIDKLDKFSADDVRLLLTVGRKDSSGDVTKGAGLTTEQAIQLLAFVRMPFGVTASSGKSEGARVENILGQDAYVGHDNAEAIRQLDKEIAEKGYDNPLVVEGAEELRRANAIFGACDYAKKVMIDPSVVRGLEYYTGMVYEAELLFPVTNEKGEEVVFGSVGGGGRYDGLVSRFRGEPVPATGFSIGVSRLMTALKNLGKLSTGTPQGPVVVCVMDRNIEALAAYQRMVQALRQADVRAEMFQGNPKQFGKQLQYADRRNSPLCIIQGSNERDKGVVQIKDMIEGKREAAAFESNAEYKAARPGQYEVSADALVDEVKTRLAEQAADQDAKALGGGD